MDVREGKALKITIKQHGLFVEEVIKNIGDYKIIKRYNERKKSCWEDIYVFHQNLRGIEEMIVAKDHIQITLKELDSENYIEILRKLFGNRKSDDWSWVIREISCTYYEGYTARTYKELKEYRVPNLLPDFFDEEHRKRVLILEGMLECWDWKITDELCRCKASFFDMSDAVSFASKTTVELENQSREFEEIIKDIKNTVKYAKTYKRIHKVVQKDI